MGSRFVVFGVDDCGWKILTQDHWLVQELQDVVPSEMINLIIYKASLVAQKVSSRN